MGKIAENLFKLSTFNRFFIWFFAVNFPFWPHNNSWSFLFIYRNSLKSSFDVWFIVKVCSCFTAQMYCFFLELHQFFIYQLPTGAIIFSFFFSKAFYKFSFIFKYFVKVVFFSNSMELYRNNGVMVFITN